MAVVSHRTAILMGTPNIPFVRLEFRPRERLSPTKDTTLLEWVKAFPGRRWNAEDSAWDVTGFSSMDPYEELRTAGFEVSDEYDTDARTLRATLAEYRSTVLAKIAKSRTTTLVRPRFMPFDEAMDVLGAGAEWDKTRGRFEVPTTDLIDEDGNWPFEVEFVDANAAVMGKELHRAADPQVALVRPEDVVIPSWFGLDLYPYQREGIVEAVANGKTLIADPPGLGKGSPHWVRILTPTGWTTYGDVEVGDQVIGSDGKAHNVTGVFRRGVLDTYKVTFSDGASVVVDGDHLWAVETSQRIARGYLPRVVTTKSLVDEDLTRWPEPTCGGTKRRSRRSLNFIPIVAPVEFAVSKEPLPLDPYVMGVLIGDGSFRTAPSLTSQDTQIVDEVSSRLPDGVILSRWPSASGRSNAETYGISAPGLRGNPVKDTLRELGLWDHLAWQKFIPEQYLLASKEDRLELLKGLADTDGSVGEAPNVTTSSPDLARDIAFLVRSLGGTTVTNSFTPTYPDRLGVKKRGRLAYKVKFHLPHGVNPFRLTAKNQDFGQTWRYPPARSIKSIEWAGREEVTCISVDAPDALYVTEDFIVTHNTRQGLGVAAATGAARTVIVTPPVMLTGWKREAEASGIAHGHDHDGNITEEGQVVLWAAGKKIQSVPERGVVVVSDSLIAARPELFNALVDWKPDALCVDEAHRGKTWASKRSKVIRALAGAVDGPRMALTGTPLFANPVELAGVMAITGHLTKVFGGYGKYVIRYAQQNRFKAWVARKKMLPELRRRLYDEVWVRRERDEVLDLPAMSRHTLYTDVDLRGFNQAHKDVIEKIDEWIGEVREVLNESTPKEVAACIREYAANSLEFVTMMRRAAGLAKIGAAQEYAREWVEASPKDKETGEWPAPLILWTHHKTVTRAMYEAAIEATGDEGAVRVIDGSTSQDERTVTVDDFQAGQVAILVASITAAGVGITLTRSTDAVYVETDWTPALIQQADFRINRIGQTKPTRVTTMVAPGTLDEYIHKALDKKGEILNAILGGDQDVSAEVDLDDVSTPMQIVTDMVYDRLAGRSVSNVRSKARKRKPLAAAA